MSLPTIGWSCTTLGVSIPVGLSESPLGPISIDTRTLRPGDTFWAIRGERDGHAYVTEAFTKGAKAAVVAESWMRTLGSVAFADRVIRVDDPRSALSTLGRAWRKKLPAKFIGVTGTNGKTTTKDLAIKVLGTGFKVAGTSGNLNNDLGVPLTVLGISDTTEVAVVEMGASHAGEIAALCQICQPTHGLVTSIGMAHLSGFGSLTALARTKGELYDFVCDHGIAFVPTDDELCRVQASMCTRKIGYGFGTRPDSWINGFHRGESLEFDDEARATFEFHGHRARLAAPGYPAALAALAALAVAASFNLDLATCVQATSEWTGASGRARVRRAGTITILDDSYNANPSSVHAALSTLSRMKAGRRMAILGDMNELGDYCELEHRRLGESLAQFDLDQVLLVGPASRWTAESAAANQVAAIHFTDYESLDSELAALVRPGDVILVKASRSSRLERAVDKLIEMSR